MAVAVHHPASLTVRLVVQLQPRAAPSRGAQAGPVPQDLRVVQVPPREERRGSLHDGLGLVPVGHDVPLIVVVGAAYDDAVAAGDGVRREPVEIGHENLLHVRRLDLDDLAADGVHGWVPREAPVTLVVPEARAVDHDVGVMGCGVGEAGELALLELTAAVGDALVERPQVARHLHDGRPESPPARDVHPVRVE